MSIMYTCDDLILSSFVFVTVERNEQNKNLFYDSLFYNTRRCLACGNRHRSRNTFPVRGQVKKKKKIFTIFVQYFIIFIKLRALYNFYVFTESKRRRFHPLRGLRRIFRRKAPSPEPNEVKSSDDVIEPPGLDTSRCRSTSQLIDEPFTRRRCV